MKQLELFDVMEEIIEISKLSTREFIALEPKLPEDSYERLKSIRNFVHKRNSIIKRAQQEFEYNLSLLGIEL